MGMRVVNSGGMCVARLCTIPLLLFSVDELRNETHVKHDPCWTGTGKGETIPKTYNVNMQCQISPKQVSNFEHVVMPSFGIVPFYFRQGHRLSLLKYLKFSLSSFDE
jgi:hypothetical protein